MVVLYYEDNFQLKYRLHAITGDFCCCKEIDNHCKMSTENLNPSYILYQGKLQLRLDMAKYALSIKIRLAFTCSKLFEMELTVISFNGIYRRKEVPSPNQTTALTQFIIL